ncbi:MAG: hypothetical protein KDK27_19035 [Leptospiraceae bacterium]|nr:hypothetical protein [Leptospiraceae bacterium]
MKFILKNGMLILILGLFLANVLVFVSGISLSDEVVFYDSEIKRLKQENLELEKEAYRIGSLQHAASEAAELHYTQRPNVVYLDTLQAAR